MKTFFLLLALLLSLAATRAATVTLAWNASATPGVQYRVKWGFASGSVNQTHIVEAGTGLTTTIEEPWAAGSIVYFTAYAWNAGGESVASNEVQYTVPFPTPTPAPTATPMPTPAPPTNLRQILEQVLSWWRERFLS